MVLIMDAGSQIETCRCRYPQEALNYGTRSDFRSRPCGASSMVEGRIAIILRDPRAPPCRSSAALAVAVDTRGSVAACGHPEERHRIPLPH
jgi:hypothetical protein